jgi:hypothetical protein
MVRSVKVKLFLFCNRKCEQTLFKVLITCMCDTYLLCKTYCHWIFQSVYEINMTLLYNKRLFWMMNLFDNSIMNKKNQCLSHPQWISFRNRFIAHLIWNNEPWTRVCINVIKAKLFISLLVILSVFMNVEVDIHSLYFSKMQIEWKITRIFLDDDDWKKLLPDVI